MDDLLTLEDTSRYLKLTKSTVYRLTQQGKIPASKVGKVWRFQKAKLAAWLETCSNERLRVGVAVQAAQPAKLAADASKSPVTPGV